MKSIIHLGKRWLKKSPGFTLAELMVAMAIGSFVVTSVLAVWTQLFIVTATNSNYMAAFRQVQNGGDWISRDALMTQSVYVMDTEPATEDYMDPAILASTIDEADEVITVDSTIGFPLSGVICIEDELIRYDTKTDTQFNVFDDPPEGVVEGRGYGGTTAASHSEDTPVTFLVALNWTTWGEEEGTDTIYYTYEVTYNIKEISRQLMRSRYIEKKNQDGIVLEVTQDATIIAQGIDPASTSSQWNYDERELTVVITAQVGNRTATRTYRVNPRPFF